MGVFTTIPIPKDEVIMRITGDVIDEDECCRREEEENNVYIFYNGDNYIDVLNTPVIKYINHECDYNCYVDEGDETSLLLYAYRDIQPGEELTIDYGYDEIYDRSTRYWVVNASVLNQHCRLKLSVGPNERLPFNGA